MLFNSYTFIVFFVLVIAISRALSGWRSRKAFLLVASYLFYAAWNPPFVLLLWISTIADWNLAAGIHRARTPLRRKSLLAASLLINLGMLGYFKYGGFLLENTVWLLNAIGIPYHPAAPSIILPVGISFYTFQTLSYTFDVYRKRITPWHSFLDYALYVTFFPQLVAGPIVRATDFLPQCRTPRKATNRQFAWGINLLIIGLFSKVVVADAIMAGITERVYDQAAALGFVEAWAGTLAFSLQIFCDFSGYSLCAIGVALCLGFVLPDNFHFPYAAVGFSDFWRRWHISLSTWLRDYLYISLGGNRKGALSTYVNLMLTMLIGGLWHGASWLFVVWGGLHGLYLIVERGCRRTRVSGWSVWQSGTGQVAVAVITYIGVCVAWVFFRAGTMEGAWRVVRNMFVPASFSVDIGLVPLQYVLVGVGTVTVFAGHWLMRSRTLEDSLGRCPWPVRSGIMALLLFGVLLAFHGEDRAFIYFQF